MQTNWAAEHLQVIRTLMERSALYRRALAPIMTFTGIVGMAAALAGYLLHIDSSRMFILYWLGVGGVAVAGSFFLVRRQAVKESEPFWSPPTRRVTQAALPPLFAGLLLSVVLLFFTGDDSLPMTRVIAQLWLPLGWIILYGCALHAAGFFMSGGMKIFGWAFVIGGCCIFALGIPDWPSRRVMSHGIMGFFFGALHLAYGVYLYFTEKGKNVA